MLEYNWKSLVKVQLYRFPNWQLAVRACEAPILSQFGFAQSRKLDFLDRWIGFAVTAHGWGWERISSSTHLRGDEKPGGFEA